MLTSTRGWWGLLEQCDILGRDCPEAEDPFPVSSYSPKLCSLCSPANRMMCSMYLLLLVQVFSETYFVTFTCFLHFLFFIITKVFNSYGS